MARSFLEKGHRLFLLDIDEEELNHTVKVYLKDFSGTVESTICDLSDTSAIHSAVEKAVKFFNGRIDVLINNGGIASPKWRDEKTMEDAETLEEWQAYLAVNLTAPFAMSQACIPYMKRQATDPLASEGGAAGPCIIHIGSVRAYTSDPDQEGYATSKSALLGLTHSMAISCQRWHIRVNLVAPGRVKVDHECKAGDEGRLEWAHQQSAGDIDQMPTNRVGMPEDIVDAVEYLMNAGFVTGQVSRRFRCE